MSFTFRDRVEPIQAICDLTANNTLLNVYGEAGIGKSRLLQEVKVRLQRRAPPALVSIINIEHIQSTPDRLTAFLQVLVDQTEGKLSHSSQSNEQLAESIVSQLNELATKTAVYLMFDTTETFQDDIEFWDWVHLYITEPLVIEGQVRQVYAGRIPVPWRRFELRRTVRLLPLGPITPEEASRELVIEVLRENNSALQDPKVLEQLVNLVLEFSFGHPALSERLAAYIAQHWPLPQPLDQFRKTLCEQAIVDFIDNHLFQDVDPLWREILWWASVLDWFDPTILQQYLKRVMPELNEKPDYFFIREVARLRTHNTVVWREQRGDRLHGLIQDIVRQCFKTLKPAKYHQACEAAADTFAAIAKEFEDSEEKDYAQSYQLEAQSYRQRANESGEE